MMAVERREGNKEKCGLGHREKKGGKITSFHLLKTFMQRTRMEFAKRREKQRVIAQREQNSRSSPDLARRHDMTAETLKMKCRA